MLKLALNRNPRSPVTTDQAATATSVGTFPFRRSFGDTIDNQAHQLELFLYERLINI